MLRKRKIYDHITWTYSLYHADDRSLKEFFESDYVISCIKNTTSYFKSQLFNLNQINLLEYKPLVNSRVHLMHSDKCGILNNEFKHQYTKFIV